VAGAADTRTRVTEIVSALESDPEAAERSSSELVALVYDQLRSLARAYLAAERPGHTLQATALVHEAFVRMVDQSRVSWKGRGHFFAVGARTMRRVLVDHARRRRSHKRGGSWQRVTLADAAAGRALDLDDLLALDAALDRLATLDPRQARVVELRYFAGFGTAETARLLGVSARTVEGDWTHARAWLQRELAPEQSG
jgi:RNA polymerase sigma factor (TIGR02999 family)